MKRLSLMVLCFLALAYLFEGDRQAHSALVKLPPQEEAGIKSTRAFYEMLVGDWTGPYSLWTRLYIAWAWVSCENCLPM